MVPKLPKLGVARQEVDRSDMLDIVACWGFRFGKLHGGMLFMRIYCTVRGEGVEEEGRSRKGGQRGRKSKIREDGAC